MNAIHLSIEGSNDFYIKSIDIQEDNNYFELFNKVCNFVFNCQRVYDEEKINSIFAHLPFDTVIINPFYQSSGIILGRFQYPTHDILGMVRDILDSLVEHLILKGIIRKELRMAYYNLIDIRETNGLDIIHPRVEGIPDESGAITP